jgi:[acyl-carrier-protein] S-malonyltransferase
MTLAILCSGQGGQHAGMLDLLADQADEQLEEASRIAGFDVGEAVDHRSMFDNAVAQPLLCATQAITWSLLAPRLAAIDVAPTLFAGYSVGELAAYGCAGALSFEDLIGLAGRRAAVMDAASGPRDGLVALRGMTRATVEALCDAHGVYVAIVNGDDQYLVGGAGDALDAIAGDAQMRGAGVQRLPVAIAAHTPLLAAAANAFRGDLDAIAWRTAWTPIVAGIDGTVVKDPATAIDMLSRQIAQTIHWSACMDSIHERGATVCLELGPGNALARLMRERHPTMASRSVADFRSLGAVVDWVVNHPR